VGPSAGGQLAAPSPDQVVEVLRQALSAQPELERVFIAAFNDTQHPLNLRTALLHPQRSSVCLNEIGEIAAMRPIDDADFRGVVVRTANIDSVLFKLEVPGLSTADNASRFDDEFRKKHPIIASMGDAPSVEELLQLDAYAHQLRVGVMRQLRNQLSQIAGKVAEDGFPLVNTRAKDGTGIVDKIGRMRQGSPEKPPRPNYSLSDMPDALGGRITVTMTADSPHELAGLATRFEKVFAGDILERDSFYANPIKRERPYRVVTYTLGIGGMRAEVQLTTLSASIAADLAHNTLHKPLIPLNMGESEQIMLFWRKATARELEVLARRAPEHRDGENLT